MLFLLDYDEYINKFYYNLRNNSFLFYIFSLDSFKVLNAILIKELLFINYSYNFYLILVSFINLIYNKYISSLKVYRSVHNYLIEVMYLFKIKNTYMQARYNSKIVLQKSVGLYGYRKKKRTTKYAKIAVTKGFLKRFSKLSFIKGNTIHFILKGLKSSYKKNMIPFVEHLKFRIKNKKVKSESFFKWLAKKIKILRGTRKNKLSYKDLGGSKVFESNKTVEMVKSKSYSFVNLRLFYISTYNFGGIRLRRRNKSQYRGY